ncbi:MULTISPECIES: TIR domain-containing protein [Chryseobacterium]|uniref:TIR domain-containing protein n=1 Tax=Chryseobacterium indicum TaxID=2766954 RepID=A0ABS9C4Y9_9FLAO|nr:TIR domain-containing protein [Chryseobacterium sp. PS-8]MCF2218401.1 TIR domain-containing protein [Chryseobacterium sp. PS-8]
MNNIFISWSGEASMKIAQELKNWLPKIIQSSKPYYTPDDIEKGTRWLPDINAKLSECLIGLICLTKDNTEKPWILFEAGALSNRLEKSKVCPILFGLKKSEVTSPLSNFQLTTFNSSEMFDLVKSINNSMDERAVDKEVLKSTFDAFFPEFQKKIEKILNEDSSDIKKPERSERDILEEILDLVRKHENIRTTNVTSASSITLQDLLKNYPQNTEKIIYNIGDKVSHILYGYGIVDRVIIDEQNRQAIWVNFENGHIGAVRNDIQLTKLL